MIVEQTSFGSVVSASSTSHTSLLSDVCHSRGGFEGEPRLPDATRADERHQPVRLQDRPERVHVAIVPDHCCQRRTEIGARPCSCRVARLTYDRLVLLEDRGLEGPQLGRRLETQLPAEDVTRALIRPQGFGLPARTRQRHHELGVQMLAERMRTHELFELADQGDVAPEREIRIDANLRRYETRFGEPRNVSLRELLVGEVDERITTPDPQCLVEQLTRARRVARADRLVAERGECVKAHDVDRRRVDREGVSTAPAFDQVVSTQRGRSRDTWRWSAFARPGGTSSPHNASTSRSSFQTSPHREGERG